MFWTVGLCIYLIPMFVMSVWVPMRVWRTENGKTVMWQPGPIKRIGLSLFWPVVACLWLVARITGDHDDGDFN